ncbi:hypothetical protein SH2C18_21480 [Clostridium sediminicola]
MKLPSQINKIKLLLIILASVVVLLVFYKLVLQSQTEKIKELSEINNSYVQQLKNVEQNEKYDKELEKNILDVEKVVENSVGAYFPSTKQEKLILIIDSFISNNDLICSNMSFSATTIEGVEEILNSEAEEEFLLKNLVKEYGNLKNKDSSNEKNEADSNNLTDDSTKKSNENEENKFLVENMKVSLEIEGSYENIANFINGINTYNKKIIIRDITIEKLESDETTGERGNSVSINLDFYAIPKLKEDKTDFDYNNWTLSNVYGKENPFK